MKKKNFWIIVCLCLMLVVAVTMGCFAGSGSDQPGRTQGEAVQASTQAAPAETMQDTAAAETEEADYIAIGTQYGVLYYPEQWDEFLVTTQIPSGDVITVAFAAAIGEGEYPIFQVSIGGGEGVEVGVLTDEAGNQRAVYLNVDEILEYPELTEGEQQRLYAMQEDLNYLIDNLK